MSGHRPRDADAAGIARQVWILFSARASAQMPDSVIRPGTADERFYLRLSAFIGGAV